MKAPRRNNGNDSLAQHIPFILLALGISASARAQSAAPLAGMGRATFSLNLDTATGLSDHGGCTFVGGEIFVCGTDAATGLGAMAAYDVATGNVRRVQLQATNASGGAISWLFCTTDGTHLIVLGKPDPNQSTTAIYYFDVQGAPVNMIQAAAGMQTVMAARATQSGSPSGIAFDPQGNAGTGTLLLCGSNSAQIGTMNLAGSTSSIMTDPIGGAAQDCKGIALDPLTRHLWTNVEPSPTALDALDELEFETATSSWQPTGATARVAAAPPVDAGDIAIVPGGLDNLPTPRGGSDLITIVRDSNGVSTLIGRRLHLVDGYAFDQEAKLLTGVDGSATTGISPAAPTGSTLNFDLDRPLPYLAFVTIEPSSLIARPVGPLLGSLFSELWELRVPTPFTVPTNPLAIQLSGTGGQPRSLDLSSISSLVGGGPHAIRIQAIYADFALTTPLAITTTNVSGWDLQ